jgi:hypothetical protein
MALHRDNDVPLSFTDAVRYIGTALLADLISRYNSGRGGAPLLDATYYAVLLAEKARRDAFLQTVEEANRVVLESLGMSTRYSDAPDIAITSFEFVQCDSDAAFPRVPVDWEIPT